MPDVPDDLFVAYDASDDAEAVFRKTVGSATDMLWALDVPEETLAALFDVLQAAVGEQGLYAALSARLVGGGAPSV
jgi:hypothetical protein